MRVRNSEDASCGRWEQETRSQRMIKRSRASERDTRGRKHMQAHRPPNPQHMDAMKRKLELVLVGNLFLCLCLGIEVLQKEKFLSSLVGENVTMSCSHNDQTYLTMLWYQQKKRGGMKLIAYSSGKDDSNIEDNAKKWDLQRPDILKSSLTITRAAVQDSAVYFCASKGGFNSGNKLDFGQGTVVSVLGVGKEIRAPEVSIYGPNRNELKDHEFISLVCVASNFFPEHVKIRWFVNNEERVNLYEPIPQIKSDNSSYSTSKRLTLTRSEYFNVDSTFRCQAAFLNGENATFAYVKGEEDCGISKESYTMLINEGKISYIMVLCKSGLYAVIILVLLWRKKMILSSY